MRYDLYPILTDELKTRYNIEDEGDLYKYIYITASIIYENKKIKSELVDFILDELNISVFKDKNSKYIEYKGGKYFLYEWAPEFIETFKFCASGFGDEVDIKTPLESVYLKGYRKASKKKNSEHHKDYIKLERYKAANEHFGIQLTHKQVEGFGQLNNYNPFKRSKFEILEANLAAERAKGAKDTSDITEKDLEDYLIKNLELIEPGLRFVSRQVEVTDGFVDILAEDSNGILCIIEIKINEDKSMIWQSLYYPDEIKKIYNREKLRMITVAPKYSAHIKSVLSKLGNIEMKEYEINVELGEIVNLRLSDIITY